VRACVRACVRVWVSGWVGCVCVLLRVLPRRVRLRFTRSFVSVEWARVCASAPLLMRVKCNRVAGHPLQRDGPAAPRKANNLASAGPVPLSDVAASWGTLSPQPPTPTPCARLDDMRHVICYSRVVAIARRARGRCVDTYAAHRHRYFTSPRFFNQRIILIMSN
jgi:hypothetical protein